MRFSVPMMRNVLVIKNVVILEHTITDGSVEIQVMTLALLFHEPILNGLNERKRLAKGQRDELAV